MDQSVPTNNSLHTEPVTSVSETVEQTDPPEPKADNRIAILELLERGEIDIDDAMAQLEAEKER